MTQSYNSTTLMQEAQMTVNKPKLKLLANKQETRALEPEILSKDTWIRQLLTQLKTSSINGPLASKITPSSFPALDNSHNPNHCSLNLE